jgi:hypothetical protein
MYVFAALALRLKMNAEETSVIWLDRYAEQEALEGRSARSRRVAVCISTEIRAVLAHTKVRMRSIRSYSGQHVVQGVAHRGLLLRVERVHGAHQDLERIARNRFMTFVGQAESNASPIRLRPLAD